MAVRRCSHQRKVTGVIQYDLSRTDGQNSVYSCRFNVTICTDCGHTDFYCESHEAVCDWLASKSVGKSPLPKSSNTPVN